MSGFTPLKTELIVALDFASESEARVLIKQLQGTGVIFKVGLELFQSAGPSFVKNLCDQGERIFLDLKFYDIPNTVGSAVGQACRLGVEMLTLHLSGGPEMCKAALDARDSALQAGLKQPDLLGVSVLTSFSEESWKEQMSRLSGSGVSGSVSDAVSRLVALGDNIGLQGVVCSAHELVHVRKLAPRLKAVVPGIRPEGSAAGDQARVMTPLQAAENGAWAIVVGRPITRASDALVATQNILSDLKRSSVKNTH